MRFDIVEKKDIPGGASRRGKYDELFARVRTLPADKALRVPELRKSQASYLATQARKRGLVGAVRHAKGDEYTVYLHKNGKG